MVILCFLLFLYFILIIALTLGNRKLRAVKLSENPKTKVSVLIAFRNEEKYLKGLVQSLLNQNYPIELIELVFVNDHSVDSSTEILKNTLRNCKISNLVLDLAEGEGKKSALDLGINQSKGEFILTIDADCIMDSSWLLAMISQFEKTQSSFIAGPVGIMSNSFLGDIFQIEFAALIASTSGGFGINRPFMCNGANLGFSRKVYDQLNPYQSTSKIASGDDVFFLHQVKKSLHHLSFVNKREALVKSKGASSFLDFINQRTRWAGKSRAYRDLDTLLIGLIVLSANVGLLVTFFWFVLGRLPFTSLLGLYLFKTILDLVLLSGAKSWILAKNVLLNSLLLSFIYPFYSVGIALLSLIFKPRWKDRKI